MELQFLLENAVLTLGGTNSDILRISMQMLGFTIKTYQDQSGSFALNLKDLFATNLCPGTPYPDLLLPSKKANNKRFVEDDSFIRVDADELTYPAHVILRYEIERALIEGAIEVDDIPALWNEKMQAYLGLSTEGNYRNGCMQDIHWAGGSFGYFPSYTLGAIYAAQEFAAAERAIPQLREKIAAGNFDELFNWLKEHIWSKGSLLSTDELMISATGEPLNARISIKAKF